MRAVFVHGDLVISDSDKDGEIDLREFVGVMQTSSPQPYTVARPPPCSSPSPRPCRRRG